MTVLFADLEGSRSCSLTGTAKKRSGALAPTLSWMTTPL